MNSTIIIYSSATSWCYLASRQFGIRDVKWTCIHGHGCVYPEHAYLRDWNSSVSLVWLTLHCPQHFESWWTHLYIFQFFEFCFCGSWKSSGAFDLVDLSRSVVTMCMTVRVPISLFHISLYVRNYVLSMDDIVVRYSRLIVFVLSGAREGSLFSIYNRRFHILL